MKWKKWNAIKRNETCASINLIEKSARLGWITRNFKIFIFEGKSQEWKLGWIYGSLRIRPIWLFYWNGHFPENRENHMNMYTYVQDEFVKFWEFSPVVIFRIWSQKWRYYVQNKHFEISRNSDYTWHRKFLNKCYTCYDIEKILAQLLKRFQSINYSSNLF